MFVDEWSFPSILFLMIYETNSFHPKQLYMFHFEVSSAIEIITWNLHQICDGI